MASGSEEINPGPDPMDSESLSELFDKAFDLFNSINKTQEPTNSHQVQSDVKRAMRMFENSTKLVSLVDMFSENEAFEEVPTENLKYFLLPALLGTLTTKICGAEDRMHIVDVAEIYFVDFLRRMKKYGLTDIHIPEVNRDEREETAIERVKSNAEMITDMVNARNTKIQRYTQVKELEGRLQTLKQSMDDLNIDDEAKREYFETLLKVYINQAIDELASLAAERPILEHMKKIGHTESNASHKHKNRPSAPPLQPYIITRDDLQKKVYGAGYPSLPVLTVQEFYDQRVKDGDWPDPSQRNQVNSRSLQDVAKNGAKSQEDIEAQEKEEKVEADDEELLNRARAMDEYKDDHRRGWGNRANRS
ncbi:immunoglobulin-binding protein 1b [Belonocnema kinseyi]|uniref:immunoglobulin-binding protein 1b n=1 Tax=Belonocnema kinseyi TaxID=2817044 RepID=UPI00143E0580|nr:immunoglobulin-binding protein 1b [Belonocnema kinseyi]